MQTARPGRSAQHFDQGKVELQVQKQEVFLPAGSKKICLF